MPPGIHLQLTPQALGLPVPPEQRKEVETRLKELRSTLGDSVSLETTSSTSSTGDSGSVSVYFRPGKPSLSDSGGGSGGNSGEGGQRQPGGGGRPLIIDIAYLAAWSSIQTGDMLARSTKEIVVNAAENQRTEAQAALKKLLDNIDLKPLMQVVEVLVKIFAVALSAVLLASSIAAAVASGGAALPLVALVISGIGMLMAVVGATPAVDEMARTAPGMKIAWDVLTIAVSLAGLGVGVAGAAAKTAAETATKVAETTVRETTERVQQSMSEMVQQAVREGGEEAGHTMEETVRTMARQAGEEAGRQASQEVMKTANQEMAEVMARKLTIAGKATGAVTATSGVFSTGLNAVSQGNESEAVRLQGNAKLSGHNQEAAMKLGEETMEAMKTVTDAALSIIDTYAQVMQSMHNSRALSTAI